MVYNLLLRYKDQYELIFYSYIIMDNHIHLSGKVPLLEKFSAFFRIVNSMLAKEINKRRKRCGQVVRERFKSPRIQDEGALIQEMIYHDLNEVRAGKSQDPKNNELSSYAHYAHGKLDPLITEPEIYKNLGKTPEERQKAYRVMVLQVLVVAPRKKNGVYKTNLFIGDPFWVQSKYEELKALRQNFDMMYVSGGSDPPF